jgi:hypothetical protein
LLRKTVSKWSSSDVSDVHVTLEDFVIARSPSRDECIFYITFQSLSFTITCFGVKGMVDNRPPPTLVSFTATMISNNRDDALREFIVAFFVEDSSFSVVEKVVPNSGFQGGKFLNRTKVLNPATGKRYEPDEVTIGMDVAIGGWKFHLKSASEGTLKTMEAHSDQFSRSDLSGLILPVQAQLLAKKEQLKAAFERRDARKKGRIERSQIARVMAEFGVTLGEQEVLTLFRRFQFADSDLFEYNEFLSMLG